MGKGSTDAARVMFHIGGVTVLSLLVNGILSDPLLKYLGLAKVDPARQAIRDDVVRQIRLHSKVRFDELCGDKSSDPSEKGEVLKLCTILEGHGAGHSHEEQGEHGGTPLLRAAASETQNRQSEWGLKPRAATHTGEGLAIAAGTPEPLMQATVSEGAKKQAIVAVRELFLRSLRHQYEEQGKSGILPRGSPGDFALRSSVDYASEEVDEGLTDIAHVFKQINKQGWYGSLFHLTMSEWMRCTVLHTVIAAHAEARETLEEALGSMKVFEEAKEAVLNESITQVALAQNALDDMNSALVQAVGPRQIACKVLAGSEEHIEKMVAAGMLREADAHHLLEETEQDILNAQKRPRGK